MIRPFGKYLFFLRLSGRLAAKAVRTRLLGTITPDVLVIELTAACNIHCRACYISKSESPRKLPRDIVLRLLSESEAIGIPHVSFSGGEPLLEAETILHCLAKFPGTSFSIATNGFLLRRELVDRLAGFPNVQVILSTDGPDASARFRHPDAPRRFAEAAALLGNAGIRHGSSTRVYRENIGEVASPAFLSLLSDTGCSFAAFSPLLPYDGSSGDLTPLTTAERKQLDHSCLEARKRPSLEIIAPCLDPGPCAGGGRILSVTPAGAILPCPHIAWSCHRFPKHSLKEALESAFFTALRDSGGKRDRTPCLLLDHPTSLQELLIRHPEAGIPSE